jgi:cysteinyl-tRNA synthetase, unknown class
MDVSNNKITMKNLIFILTVSILFMSCNKEDGLSSSDKYYRQEMRDFVIGISTYAKTSNPTFLIIPQNGIELITNNGEEDGPLNAEYLNAIDGNGQEDLFYGYENDDQPTPSEDNVYTEAFLDRSHSHGKVILVTDYCSAPTRMDDSYNRNNNAGYVSFAADHRELNNIPNYPHPIYAENNASISSLSEVKNFLYLINPENYTTKSAFVNAIISTNYDLLIMDLFFNDGTEFSATEIDQLKNKANGGKRLVISYLSIGEAEDYRYYWQSAWETTKPSWLGQENPDWEGNFNVNYWDKEWQNIIYGNDNSYLKKIMNAHFDGVYLDIIDAYEYYE